MINLAHVHDFRLSLYRTVSAANDGVPPLLRRHSAADSSAMSRMPLGTNRPARAGFTLLELLIVMVILAVVLAWGIPSWRSFLEKDRLRNAAEASAGALNDARMEAIKRNAAVYAQFKGTTTWCLGVSTQSSCDCQQTDKTASDYCSIQRISGDDFPGVSLDASSASYQAGFDPVRGTLDSASSAHTLVFSSGGGYQVDVNVGIIGSVGICSPSGGQKVIGYPDC